MRSTEVGGGDHKARRDARRRIATFVILTSSFTALVVSLAIVIGTEGDSGDLLALGVMWSPGLAGLATVFLFQRNFRGMGWGLGKPRYLLVGYGLPLAECSLVYGVVWLVGLGDLRGDALGVVESILNVTPDLVAGAFLALGEEIGWRGFLVPQLARVTSFTRTALTSGAIHAAWHWPFVLFFGFSSAAPRWFALIVLTATVTLAGFLAAWLRLRSGSLWPVVIAHATFNLYVQSVFEPLTRDTGATEYITDEFGVAFVLTGIVVAYVSWRLRHRLPESPRRAPERGAHASRVS